MRPLSSLISTLQQSVRYKLLVLALLPVGLILPVVIIGLTAWGASFTYDQLYTKVHTDLAVAHDLFERLQHDRLDQLTRLGESYTFRAALDAGDDARVQRLVDRLRQDAGFSFLRAIEPSSAAAGSNVGIEILSHEELAAIDPMLAAAVRLPLVQTQHARPTERRLEDRAMVIRARHGVVGVDGTPRLVLDGGVLLNNNFAFVDAIRDLVYGPGSLPPGSIGTVTVFLDDVRISTNVPRQAGERALGTRVSEEVSHAVLDRGKTWIDRAFVVNDWYISAYEPIVDRQGDRVGMLYAGYLEAPFRTALWRTLAIALALLLAVLGLYGLVALRGAKSIFHPVERMFDVVHGTRLGQQLRIGALQSRDELGELAREFDAMLDRIDRHTQEIERWAHELEDRVDARTNELTQRNDELQRTINVLRETRRKLVTAEKLAALGELTAGVAHEINNPTQVMLGNLDILTAELGDSLDPVRTEIDLVIEQVYRIQGIVEKLLKYAHPGDYAGYLAAIDVNRLIRDTVALISHMQRNRAFRLHLDLTATQPVTINEQELQQVLVNLVSNAVHALPDVGGEITLAAKDWPDHGVCISVTDNGTGMDHDQCAQIFNPFYTTKGTGEGTGLGLSVSYGLIRRYGGDINVTSEPGRGSCFKVWLRSEPRLIEDAETIAEQLRAAEQDGRPVGVRGDVSDAVGSR